MIHQFKLRAVAAAVSMTLAGVAVASSHPEAPFITNLPKVDASDFYMFNSYETGRTGFVTIIANYLPLQDSYGGPNYFELAPDALYEISLAPERPTPGSRFPFPSSTSAPRARPPTSTCRRPTRSTSSRGIAARECRPR